MTATPAGRSSDLELGTVTGAGPWAVGRTREGDTFAVSRRCRHLAADLAGGSIGGDGCLVCPWHGARYDVTTGRMVQGPRGAFAWVPGLGVFYRTMTRVVPLRRGHVEERDGDLFVA